MLQGAIKKTYDSKNASTHHLQKKSKTLKSRETSDQTSKSDKEKEIHRITQNASEDSKSITDRNVITNSSMKKTSFRNNSTISQSKSIVKNETTKSNSTSSRTSVNSSRTTKVKPQIETQISKHARQTESSRSKEKIKSIISEKRGTSTLYVPESNTSKLKSLTAKQSSDSKVLPSRKSHDKKDILKESKSKRTSSRERRKSRTLSPSEVKVLHSTIAIQNQNVDCATKLNSDEDFDYEDDFEVGIKNLFSLIYFN